MAVSIHAPLYKVEKAVITLPVSIHAPARGATKRPSGRSPVASSFNPRTRTGCDEVQDNGMRVRGVSIHAPARGATPPPPPPPARSPRFNPRTRTGCDAGGDALPRPVIGFNPRTRTGCDGGKYLIGVDYEFQSTHPHGVRRLCGFFCSGGAPVSIHAPARGATVMSSATRGQSTSFNPRTRTGCDRICGYPPDTS